MPAFSLSSLRPGDFLLPSLFSRLLAIRAILFINLHGRISSVYCKFFLLLFALGIIHIIYRITLLNMHKHTHAHTRSHTYTHACASHHLFMLVWWVLAALFSCPMITQVCSVRKYSITLNSLFSLVLCLSASVSLSFSISLSLSLSLSLSNISISLFRPYRDSL